MHKCNALRVKPGLVNLLAYLGIWLDWPLLDPSAGLAGAAGVVGVVVPEAFGVTALDFAAAGTVIVSVTLLLDAVRFELKNARARVAPKKIAAAMPVDFDKKFDDPVAPNKLPDAPEPKAAPMSAPLPCCSSTRPMMVSADRTWMTTMMVSIVFIAKFPIVF